MVIHRTYIAMCRVPADTKLSKLDTLRLAMTYINHLHGMVIEADSDTGAVTPETRERENRENRENRETGENRENGDENRETGDQCLHIF